MADRVVLHIGAPKTGTTFLQAMLFHNRERLAEGGVLVPGQGRRAHALAARGLRQGPRGQHIKDWRWLVGETHRWPGTVVVSNEWFTRASVGQARRAVRQLGPKQTHVVFTARDFVEQAPAAWQETLKLGDATSLDDFVTELAAERGRWRWGVLDPAEVLERWKGELPAEQVHVVTVPPKGSDPSRLWNRFATACGFDGATCEIGGSFARESLSAESAHLMQHLGPLLRDAIEADTRHWSETYRWLQRYLSHQLLVPRTGSRILLRPDQFNDVRERSLMSVKALTEAQYHVVGDLADLTASEPSPDARHPDDVSEAEMLEVALPLVADLLRDVRTQTMRAEDATSAATAEPENRSSAG